MTYRSSAWGAALGVVVLLPALAASPLDGRTGCMPEPSSGPPDCRQTLKCLASLGETGARREEAIVRLQRLLAVPTGCRSWLLDRLGRLLAPTEPSAEKIERQAAALFAAQQDQAREFSTRAYLGHILRQQGRNDEAELENRRAIQVAEASKDPLLRANGEILAAQTLFESGSRLSHAAELLRQAKSLLDADGAGRPGAQDVRARLLSFQGNVSSELGRYSEAQVAWEGYLRLAEEQGSLAKQASGLYGLARLPLERLAELPVAAERETAVALMRRAAGAAERARVPSETVKTHWMLAELEPGAAREHLDACRKATGDDSVLRSYCLAGLARRLATSDPPVARQAMAQAVPLAQGDPWAKALVQGAAMRVAWASLPRDAALATARTALGAIEELRSAQEGGAARVGILSTWSDDYYWLAGEIQGAWSRDRDPRLLDQAFEVGEHLRARSLLETLQKARAMPLAPERLRDKSRELDLARERVERRQADPELPASEREHAREDAEALARMKRDLASRATTGAAPPPLATLSEVRRSLGGNEALLSFLVAPWRDWRGEAGGGSWLLVVTRDAPPRAYPLREMGRVELRREVDELDELLTPTLEAAPAGRPAERRREAELEADLYRKLLAPALADLPPGVDHLIVVPDDRLNLLPFAALRPGAHERPTPAHRSPGDEQLRPGTDERSPRAGIAEARGALRTGADDERPLRVGIAEARGAHRPGADELPLAFRYRITEVPSGTLWLRWRRQPAPAARKALVLANPLPPDAATLRQLGDEYGYLRERLPYAMQEAGYVEHWLDAEKRVEAEVSKEAVMGRGAPLSSFDLLHFAAHTVIDEKDPERAGIWLGSRQAGGDGLLRMSDIVGLRLDGRTVVLSSCTSAGGTFLRGEGVMSLARAFFAAGATAVVASLWPQRDDQAAALFDRFYFHLARGRSLGEALAAAQRDRAEAGAPASAWAGFIVLGEGNRVPFPAARGRLGADRRSVAAAAVLAALLAILACLRPWRKTSGGGW
jgi:hypothetical protein